MSDADTRRALALLDFIGNAIANDYGVEWHDKHIYSCDGESYQRWTYEMWLPVPLSVADKSPMAAFVRFLDQIDPANRA